ncbi:MAG: PD-(D/E)XK nuclease family protein [Eggerthellaceae bacterium]
MSYTTQHHPNAAACLRAAAELAQDAAARGQRPAIIVPSQYHQIAACKSLSEIGMGFGVDVTTPFSWLEGLWGLFGDGRCLIDGFGRTLEILKALEDETCLDRSSGIVNLLDDCAWQAAPFLENGRGLSENEQAAVAVLERYLESIHAQNLIEPSEAAVFLAETLDPSRFKPILLEFHEDDLDAAQHLIFEALDAAIVVNTQEEPSPAPRCAELEETLRTLFKRRAGEQAIVPRGALRLALASGPAASMRIVCNEIESALAEGCESVLVVSQKPADLFAFASPILTQTGTSCALDARIGIDRTDMGRALILLGELTEGITDDPLDAKPLAGADFAFNPFSGIGKASAFRIDRMHRNDRLTDRDTILSDLASSADNALAGLINRVEERAWPDVAGILRSYANTRFSQQPAYRLIQTRVIDVLESTWPKSAGLSLSEVMSIISKSTIPVCLESSENPQVRIVSPQIGQTMPAGSVDCVIFAGMSAEEQPIRNPENALETLLDKLGAAKNPDQLANARARFFSAFETARKRIVLQRPLNDAAGNPSQPATVFEETLDCYRADLRSEQGVDKVLRIPESLIPFASQLGEQDVISNAGYAKRSLRQVEQAAIGTLSDSSRALASLPYRYADGYFGGLEVSPSQIESYLDCPYCWFAKRRLRLEGIAEEFSPAERGSFMHEILCTFYKLFQSRIAPKVAPENLDAALPILHEAFGMVCDKQPVTRPGSRYIPLTAWERKERHALLKKLEGYLEMESLLLPAFEPAYFEWQFANNAPVPYAGCNLRGCIDRIDIDGRGNAVVIDYKSSLNDDYQLYNADKHDGSKPFALPRKVQALIYAKAVQDKLGLNVVAALYVNPLKKTVLGAYDGCILGPTDIPFEKAKQVKNCQVPYPYAESLSELIGLCEQEIGEKIAGMAQGIIEPSPASEHACEFCPVNICEKRLAPRRY